MSISDIRKAIVGAVVPAAGVAVLALENDGVIDPVEWIIIAVAALTSGAVVWAVPNKPFTGVARSGSPTR